MLKEWMRTTYSCASRWLVVSSRKCLCFLLFSLSLSFFFFFFFSAPTTSFSLELSAGGDSDGRPPSSADLVLEEIRREAPDLAEIIEKVREPLPKVGDRTPVSALRSAGSKGGLIGRRRSSSVGNAARSTVKKESLRCPPCDADNPIIITDGEEEKEAEKSREVGVNERDKTGRLQSDGRLSSLSKEKHSSNSEARVAEADTPAKEIESGVPSVRGTDRTAGLSAVISREDLYYDKADREELATWAEFPREVELSRRHELVVRTRQCEELRQGQSSSSGVSSGGGRSRS